MTGLFLDLINAEKANIENHLKKYLDSLHIPGVLHEAMSYSLSAGGKRLRSLVTELGEADASDILSSAPPLKKKSSRSPSGVRPARRR